jgi:hypothetical protein
MADAITLPDSQATPVDHVFTAVNVTPKKVDYVNFDVDNAIGRESLSIGMDQTSKVRRVSLNLKDPRLITETINGVDVPSVPDYGLVQVTINVPNTWDYVDAEDLVEMTSQLFQDTNVIEAITKGISPAA